MRIEFHHLVFACQQFIPIRVELTLHSFDVVGHVRVVVEEAHLCDRGVLGDRHEPKYDAVNLRDLDKYFR
jgi:hypothetical protein